MWLCEISSCSCLTVLTGPALVLISKIHKPFFLLFRMESQRVRVIATENRGRGLAANRNVSKGEELLVEPAAVVGPVQSDEICCGSCFRDIFGKESHGIKATNM